MATPNWVADTKVVRVESDLRGEQDQTFTITVQRVMPWYVPFDEPPQELPPDVYAALVAWLDTANWADKLDQARSRQAEREDRP
ncbi:MAG: hypothetical protein MUF33_02065 [Candidatus Nanopelagicales bacterium]|jgi:hypothetical protein|nr:hypothetical protein [Candidatus Nanopelagicales bacterium]